MAAGRAVRMGRPKVLLPWCGRPLLAHVLGVLVASGAAPVVVVTGPDTPALDSLTAQFAFLSVYNHEARAGMASSIAVGAAAMVGKVVATLICLGDQPTIDVAVVRDLVARVDDGRPVVPVYRGKRGHPVRFPASLLAELRGLHGDRGARDVLERYPPVRVAWDLPLPQDVDTEDDYRRLLRG